MVYKYANRLCDLDKKLIHILYTHREDFQNEHVGHEDLKDNLNPLPGYIHDRQKVCSFPRPLVLLFQGSLTAQTLHMEV